MEGTHFDVAHAGAAAGLTLDLSVVDFSAYSAIAVSSSFGGLLRRAELDGLIARKDDIKDFVNTGGGVFASAECDVSFASCGVDLITPAGGLFGYLPITATAVPAVAPFTVQAFGTGLGLLNTDVDDPTHNSFSDAAGLNIVDTDTNGVPTTLAGDVFIEDDMFVNFLKELTSGPDANTDGEIDLAVAVGQLVSVEYDFTMSYGNPGGPPVLIVDVAPAEWIVTEVGGFPVDVDQCGEFQTVSNDFGTADVFKSGKLGKKCRSSTKIHWTPNPDGGSINVVMETRQSPGKKNVKFAPTSCGPLFLNSGPAQVFEIDPATDEPFVPPQPPLFTADPLVLAAVEDLDGGGINPSGGGNEDGDALTDIEDVQHGFDPCSIGDGTLYAGSDVEEFNLLTEDRLAETTIVNGLPVATGIITPTDDFLNGLAPTGTGTLFSGEPFTDDHREINVDGSTDSTVTGPLNFGGDCCNEDLAFDGTHVWRAHFVPLLGPGGMLFKYLPDGTPVDQFAQEDVVGATFVWPADELWITKWLGREVGTFDPATNTFTSVFTTATNAGGLAYDIERGILWVGEQGGLVQAYDLTGGGAPALIAGSQHQPFGPIDETVDGLAFVPD